MFKMLFKTIEKYTPKGQLARPTFGRLGVLWAVLDAKVAKESKGEGEKDKASGRKRKGRRNPVGTPAPGEVIHYAFGE